MIPLIAITALVVGQSQSIDAYLQKNLVDGTFTARVQSGNQSELGKINKDFGLSYRFKYSNIVFKEPFKFRAESVLEGSKLSVIQNGTKQKFNSPIYKGTQNLAKSPGRMRTLLEFGLLTPSLFQDFYEAKFVRVDRATGDVVFDITYVAKLDDSTRFRVWIDPEKKYTVKREWYGQGHRAALKATFFYDNPVNLDGIWMPTRSSVRNADNKLAGTLGYEGLKINTGVSDSLFQLK